MDIGSSFYKDDEEDKEDKDDEDDENWSYALRIVLLAILVQENGS